MEETLASRKMKEIDLLKNIEKSSKRFNEIFKINGYLLKENQKNF